MFDTFCLFKFPFHLALPLSLKIFFSGDVGKIIMWSTQFLLRCPPVLSTDIMTWLFTHPDPYDGYFQERNQEHERHQNREWGCTSDKGIWVEAFLFFFNGLVSLHLHQAYFVDAPENFKALDSFKWEEKLPSIFLEKRSSSLPTEDTRLHLR